MESCQFSESIAAAVEVQWDPAGRGVGAIAARHPAGSNELAYELVYELANERHS